MRRILERLRELFARLSRRPRPHQNGLTDVEYEAVCLIAYEGREAYARAREQADYCRSMGSPSGVLFWSKIALEVARRTGRTGTARVGAPRD